MENIFLISVVLIMYTYLGYGIVVKLLVLIKNKKSKINALSDDELPTVTLLIAAYNEESCIEEKIQNAISLDYPQAKKQIFVVADGSSDHTVEIVQKFPEVSLFFNEERKGKIAAVNRVMPMVNTDITILNDANTILNQQALKELVKHFSLPEVVAVSGEKKIRQNAAEDAVCSGEGIYWKYESYLKKLDASLNTLVGAAGELIAIKTSSFKSIPENMIIEDFYMTMKYCAEGLKVAYEPNAYAMENPSDSIEDEMKRKIRISAGGFQAIVKLRYLLNPFKYGLLTFQYVSHRVLRWSLAPLALLTLLISSISLIPTGIEYSIFTLMQLSFYLLAIAGYYLKNRKINFKVLHIPYYFSMMNYAVFLGFFRFIGGNQSAIWEKSKRRI